MKRAVLLLALTVGMVLPAQARAAEAWHVVFEDAAVQVSLDMQNLEWQGVRVIVRERDIYRMPQVDPASLRKMAETQYRKAVDCATRKLAMYSVSAFTESNALFHYQAIQPNKARWSAPASETDRKILATLCGPA